MHVLIEFTQTALSDKYRANVSKYRIDLAASIGVDGGLAEFILSFTGE